LLVHHPQLAYTLFQTLVKMNVVDQFSMQRILQAQANLATAPAPAFNPTPIAAPMYQQPPVQAQPPMNPLSGMLEEQQKVKSILLFY
jgi:hypothetical protein